MIVPPLLRPNDKVSLVAPSGVVDKIKVGATINILDSWHLIPEPSPKIFEKEGYFAGSDDIRRQSLQDALDDPESQAIFCVRGGYGSTRYIDCLSIDKFISHPKWLIGFSDITALHLLLVHHDVASIHGPMSHSFSKDEGADSVDHLKKLLFKGEANITQVGVPIKEGSGNGQLVGGNLSMIIDSLGTGTEIETKGRILLIEDVAEPLYRVDRMLTHLLRTGKLGLLNGLVVGQFTPTDDKNYNSSLQQLIANFTSSFTYPVSTCFNIGHEESNYSVVHGGRYRLTVNPTQSELILLNT